MEPKTVGQVVDETIGILSGIMLPVALIDTAGQQIKQAIRNLALCQDAWARDEAAAQAAKQKQEKLLQAQHLHRMTLRLPPVLQQQQVTQQLMQCKAQAMRILQKQTRVTVLLQLLMQKLRPKVIQKTQRHGLLVSVTV